MGYVILVLVAVILVFSITVSILLFRFAICRPTQRAGNRREPDSDPKQQYRERINDADRWFNEQNPERVSIVSFDGLHLSGQFIPASVSEGCAPAGTMLLMHGYHGSGTGDFGCQIPFLHSLGFNILLPDQRAHGASEGDYICFGVFERCDCRDWCFYLNEKLGGGDIFLYGVSMGATTVMMCADMELPANVRGIIADCGFTSPYDIFKIVIRKWFHLPPVPFLQISGVVSKVVAGFGFHEASAPETLAITKLPVMLVHGASDDFVPPEMTLVNWRAIKSERKLLFIGEAPHAQSYLCDTPRYDATLGEFLRKHSSAG